MLAVVLAALVPRLKVNFVAADSFRAWLDVPWRAAAVLCVTNLLLLGLVAGLLFGLMAVDFPLGPIPLGFIGVMLSFLAWTQIGQNLPLTGRRRWLVALAGMTPHILLIICGGIWFYSIPDYGPHGEDTFMETLGALVLMIIGLGATLVGTLVVGSLTGPARTRD